MSALSFARQAFGREKPHSSITDWVDILTGLSIEEEAYDGIPELVDSINLQASGPAEASRALRKKLKHGNTHQQYRALVLLKALVENCGQKTQNTFADGHMTDALKQICNDHTADKRVRKKLLLVLASWRDQYQGDPSMSVVAGLYKHIRGNEKGRIGQQEIAQMMGLTLTAEEKKRMEKEDAKMRARMGGVRPGRDDKSREEKARLEKARLEKASLETEAGRKKRTPFNFEKEKPKVLSTIVEASQASSNLVNAITLVNPKTDSLETNERVQDCLNKAKQARKLVVRYIQLVENEELIGTLIETNDRIMTALEMYDKMCIAGPPDEMDETAAVTSAMAQATITHTSKGKTREPDSPPLHLHPDLEELNFSSDSHSPNLPAPIRPSTLSDDEEVSPSHRPSLSEFSDYASSSEESEPENIGSSSNRKVFTLFSEVEERRAAKAAARRQRLIDDNDPFADPFADSRR